MPDYLSVSFVCLSVCLSNWRLTDWLTDWQTSAALVTDCRLPNWLNDCRKITHWLSDWRSLIEWLTERLSVCLSDCWISDWSRTDWLPSYRWMSYISLMIYSVLSDWLTDWLTDWLAGCLSVWQTFHVNHSLKKQQRKICKLIQNVSKTGTTTAKEGQYPYPMVYCCA